MGEIGAEVVFEVLRAVISQFEIASQRFSDNRLQRRGTIVR